MALAFGIPVEELQERMSFREFVFWQARYFHQPFGTAWENVRFGAVSANICAGLGCKDQKIENHIPLPKKPKKKQTPAEQMAVLMGYKLKHGAK